MRINGKLLAWAIIHLNFFASLVFVNSGSETLGDFVILVLLMIFFMWRFVENLDGAFK